MTAPPAKPSRVGARRNGRHAASPSLGLAAAAASLAGEASDTARIGPNAILQTGHALRAALGEALERQMFVAAGLEGYLEAPPHEMIAEREAIALFEAMHQRLDAAQAAAILQDAGCRTGDYILANRIPVPAQRVLKILPKPLAARALLSAIGKHSWTFAGSGAVTCRYGRPLTIEIARNPLAYAHCTWHCAVFERLFATLVSARTRVAHTSCGAAGASTCRFEISV